MLARDDFYRVAKNIGEFVQDLTVFGRAAIDKEDMQNELLSRVQESGLTLKEELDGDFICPVLGKCNIKNAFRDRAEAMRREYEAFDTMHRNDGSFSKSSYSL